MAKTVTAFTAKPITVAIPLLLALLLLLLTGCATQKTWKYGPEAPTTAEPLINSTAVVMPFNDQRRNENKIFALCVLPLVPYCWQELNTPEGIDSHVNSALWSWRPAIDMAKAAADELNNSRIFREAFFGLRSGEGDLVLQGTINSTKYDSRFLSYGLSVYGTVLWLIGLPATTVSNELILSFKLEDRKNNRVLWEKQYREAIDHVSWAYDMKSDFEYADMLKKILLMVMSDMRSDISSIRSKL